MRPGSPLLLCALAAGTAVLPAKADEFDTLNVTASSTVAYDTNLFRLSDSTPLPASLGTSSKSDFITSASVGLKLNKRYAQQRIELELTETVYRYENFSFLNFEALDYRGAWFWHFTPRISGTLSADRKKTLIPFQDATGRTRVFQQALRTLENRRFDLDAMVSGPWHVLLGASQVDVDDSRIVTGEQAYSALSQEAGIKYLAGSTSSISLLRRRFDGDYQQRIDPINLLDNGFQEDQTELVARWAASGKSTVTTRIAWIERKHENFPQRDFEGVVGNLAYTWLPTGKLRLTAGARRDLSTFWDRLFSSYKTTNAVSVAATWEASAHVEAGVRLEYNSADYKGALVPGPPARRDDYYRAGMFATWSPWRNVVFRTSLDYYTRSSTSPGFDFDAAAGSLTASLMF